MRQRRADREYEVIALVTPAGTVGLYLSGKGIARIELPRGRGRFRAAARRSRPSSIGKAAAALLRRYFSGEPVSFALPLDLLHATVFQRAVWKAAAKIPYGETRSYAWIAKRIGKPQAARAVGQALGANPVPVIIPCHRVISSAGTLGGFSGGLGMKKKLLQLEKGGSFHGSVAGKANRS
jgi:methylated-DNA-[protein]-cysteine S-methyltransferase